jgi:uncharacterized protein (DUF1800 family)
MAIVGERRMTASMSPIRPAAFAYTQARHLLWRAGFGGTPEQIQTLVSWGPEKAVDYILDFDKVPWEEPGERLFDPDIMRPPTEEERRALAEARRRSDEDTLARFRQLRQMAEQEDRRQIREMQKWWLKRMIETPRPLEEKMTLFWHGHFATSNRTIENSYHMYMQNQLFRRHAVGNFGDLLFGIIRDPAMLAYLDNNNSRRTRPNENLAREIMELFALGIGNYTERDIKEGARALTGYTFEDDRFVFQRNNHDTGTKTILGTTGAIDGDGFVRVILAQRACADFISRKLYHYFAAELPSVESAPRVEDLPSPAREAVRALSSTMLASRYQIKPVLRRLFLSEHFYSPGLLNEQVKSPVELVVGAIRSLNCPARDLGVLNDALDLMGQSLFFPPSVKGWAGGRSWINTSTLFVRQNILAFLLTGKRPRGYDATADTQRYDPTPLLAELARADAASAGDPAKVVDYLLRLTLGQAPSHAADALRAFLASTGNQITRDSLIALLLLITAMPEYQLC